MAVSSAFAGVKLESILLGNNAAATTSSWSSSSSSSSSTHQIRGIFCKPTRTRRALIQRADRFNPTTTVRCEVAASDVQTTAEKIKSNTGSSFSSSLSALEQLKTSAGDSKYITFPQMNLGFVVHSILFCFSSICLISTM